MQSESRDSGKAYDSCAQDAKGDTPDEVLRIASELDALEAAGQIESWSWVGVRPSRWRYTWSREWARSAEVMA